MGIEIRAAKESGRTHVLAIAGHSGDGQAA